MNSDLDLPEWDFLPESGRERLSSEIARIYPKFCFTGLHVASLGDQRHHVAGFRYGDDNFVLIPGGQATLGYDVQNPWTPSDAERLEWDRFRSSEDHDYPELEDFIIRFLSPLRVGTIQPFLLEVSSRRLGVRLVLPADPRFKPETADHLSAGFGQVMRGGIIYHRDENNVVRATEYVGVTHAEALSQISPEGFRFPTSNEWEYACAAGSRALFRWGDHVPIEEGDLSFLEVLERWGTDDQMDDPDFDPSSLPNAFGLQFEAPTTNDAEFCLEPDILQFGDIAGGMLERDEFTGYWLPLASSYVVRLSAEEMRTPRSHVSARRLFPLKPMS